MTPFEDLLHGLGEQMGIPLKPDHNQACLLEFQDGLRVQIDLGTDGDEILVGSLLGVVPAGPYRVDLFERALIVNGAPEHVGTLSFSSLLGQLYLFQHFPLSKITGETLFPFVQEFTEHARIWKAALMEGRIPEIEQAPLKGSDGGLPF